MNILPNQVWRLPNGLEVLITNCNLNKLEVIPLVSLLTGIKTCGPMVRMSLAVVELAFITKIRFFRRGTLCTTASNMERLEAIMCYNQWLITRKYPLDDEKNYWEVYLQMLPYVLLEGEK
jgi:hypothetical protein